VFRLMICHPGASKTYHLIDPLGKKKEWRVAERLFFVLAQITPHTALSPSNLLPCL